jgi:hypothetical protein
MTRGVTPSQADLLKGTAGFVGGRVGAGSIFAVLHREGHWLFPDEMFDDLFDSRGRRSVPPQIVAVVMVLQRLCGLSDREAVDAFAFDARWKYACGGLDFDYPGFSHTVLVDMRARLARSAQPRRIFEVTLAAARRAGVVSAKRVLDSTPLYDAVATQDTVTLIRSAIRRLLAVADSELRAVLRAALTRDDDYLTAGKPVCDWDDPVERAEMVDALARDGHACLRVLEGRKLDGELADAAVLLATVLGQDLETGDDGRFAIARRVAKDRVISTVDPDARHGHKTAARGFDGYKGHVAVDPDSEIITDTTVTAANAGDASVAEGLIGDLHDRDAPHNDGDSDSDSESESEGPIVYGDNAYGTGGFQDHLERSNITSRCKTQPPVNSNGRFAKDAFDINLDDDTVTCPAWVTVSIHRNTKGEGTAHFADACTTCPLRSDCTTATGGRTIHVGIHEAVLARARDRQTEPSWQADYQATRPKVERKIAHLMRRQHGGRRARVRGKPKVAADFNLLAAAVNLARLATLGLTSTPTGWTTTT